MKKYYIPLTKFSLDEGDGYLIDVSADFSLMYPVLIKDNKAFIDNFKYDLEKQQFPYPVLHKDGCKFIEVTLETIRKTFRYITEEELRQISSNRFT